MTSNGQRGFRMGEPSPRTQRRRWLPALALGVVALAAAWHLASRTTPAQPNILLITVDTLRADRLGCYGGVLATPNIDRLAREGTLFENAACPMPVTRPSHTTILSSRYPRDTGVVNNTVKLPPDLLTLPQVLRTAGYQTAAFTGVRLLNRKSGVARGFDRFDYPRRSYQRGSAVVVPLALDWLRNVISPHQPFFLWVHLFNPHSPYSPPPAYDPGGPQRWVRELPRATWPRLLTLADRNGGNLPRGAYERVLGLYGGEVRNTDHWVAILLDGLRQRGILDRTIVAFTADHGECFEHGVFFDHFGCLYEGAAHVPLIFRYPPKIAANRRDRRVTEHVDIAPTLLTLAGVPIPAAFSGVPLLGATAAPKEYAFVQHPTYPEETVIRRTKKLSRLRFVDGRPSRPLIVDREQYALRGETWKYIVTGSVEELYDIATDPAESHNVAGQHPELLPQLRQLLQRWRTAHPARPDSHPAPLSAETREQLRALGY